jgi:predicted flap endonuclease-1-like 5' DNA nuclease
MPYTLTMGWLWFAVAFVLGLVIGVLVRTVSQRHRPTRPSPATGVTPSATDPVDELLGRIAELEHAEAERDALRAELDAMRRSGVRLRSSSGTLASGGLAPPPPTQPDVSGATAVLGREITADDLTVVEGIEPHTAMLCHWIGIHTWWDLATTEVSLLRTMLADAGSRFADVDPTTWPTQARLLAEGRWQVFADVTVDIRAGHEGAR